MQVPGSPNQLFLLVFIPGYYTRDMHEDRPSYLEPFLELYESI